MCPDTFYFWKADRWFMFDKKYDRDYMYFVDDIEVDSTQIKYFNLYQKDLQSRGFQWYDPENVKFQTVVSDGSDSQKAAEEQYYYLTELTDTIADKNYGDVKFEIIDESLVCQWNPNFFTAVLLDAEDYKVDETSN